jgi:hypothetical protein
LTLLQEVPFWSDPEVSPQIKLFYQPVIKKRNLPDVGRSLHLVTTPIKGDHIMQAKQVLHKLLQKVGSQMHKMGVVA